MVQIQLFTVIHSLWITCLNAPLTVPAHLSNNERNESAAPRIKLVIAMISCLLIDRNETTRNLVGGMLSDLGITCSQHQSWEAGKPIPRNRFDIVLVGNPEGDDYAHVPATIRHRPQHQIFYYFAQHPDVDVISRLIVHGVADVLVMPFDSQILGFKLSQAGIQLRSAAA